MKKITMLFCAFSLASLTVTSFAADAAKPGPNARPNYNFSFVKSDDKMPDATVYLPDPPKPGEPLYTNDSLSYYKGKALRGTPRGDTAVTDARVGLDDIMKRFAPALKLDLNEKDFPVVAKLMRGVMQDVRGTIVKAKEVYVRHRPYQVFNERTPLPQDESPTDVTSYPSGHAIRSWALTLLFIALDPDHQNEITKIGYELGQSRIIVGFHYQSDIDASRIAASTGFARLCAEPEFIDYLNKARAEILKARKKG